MDDLMKLVIGWTIVGGFLFTTVITCLSLVGWVRFVDPRQQKRLFSVLVVELLVGAGAQVLGGASFSLEDTRKKITTDGANEAYLTAAADMLDTDTPQRPAPDKAQLTQLLSRVKVNPASPQGQRVETLRSEVSKLPAGTIDAKKAKDLRIRIPAAVR